MKTGEELVNMMWNLEKKTQVILKGNVL